MKPSLKEEKNLWRKGYKIVACLDESGRGPLAGPVVAAAVAVAPNHKLQNTNYKQIPNSKSKIQNLRDSKKLSFKQRGEFYKILTSHNFIKWGVGVVSEKIIDKINIKNASELAMEKAIKKLSHKPDFLIIDGNHVNSEKLKAKSYKLIVRADEKVFSCAAASIIAKVTRDRIMLKLHKKYPQYGFDRHKGYPTRVHIKMLKRYGPSQIHRRSFGPVRGVLNL